MATIKRLGQQFRIVHVYVTLVATAILVLTGGSTGRHAPVEARARAGCAADSNPVRCENLLPGDSDWGIFNSGDPSIQGFATDMSVDYAGTIDFKIDTDATSYVIDIYRMGYYGGAGARKVASIAPSAALPQTQPVCQSDAALGLVDCGNWAISASWVVPDDAVSGIYFAKPTRTDGVDGASHIYFVVRDDTRTADVLFQTSDTTWQAYNTYGGASTYCAPSGVGFSNAGTAYGCLNRAVKVSYNRPFDTRDHDSQSFLFNAEYPMVRFLEANGFNVKYWSGVDTDRRGTELVGPHKPKIFVSTGHDEYWSGAQRTHVENARNAGVNLAFFSGNEIYWKHRFEPSIVDGLNHRTMVVYKETLAGAKIDPAIDPATGKGIWTGTWRDTRFSTTSDGGRPENALLGTIWTVNCCTATIQVPVAYKNLRLWQNTRIPEMTSGVANLGSETLGYEWGEALENGHQPGGLIRLSSTTVDGMEKIIDFGATVGLGSATHSLTMYRHNSGAIVFAASTVQWAWGLDSQHDRGGPAAHVPDQAMQQATITLFADMGVQPSTLQVGADPARPLVTMTPTADIFAPTSAITSPAQGSPVESGDRITVTGTAADADGVVAGVEVSVDGGVTWRKANGTTSWTFEWSPGALGNATVRSRAVDDSGNLEIPSAGVTVSVETGTCPCESLFKPSTVPDNPGFPDNSAYELGVKFVSDIDGFITGIRYYKSLNNSGTHTGSLWTLAGDRLATATFTNETATGWQEVLFETPVAITANTVYVASYHTNVGHYAVTPNYFASAGVHSPPLHAPPSTEVGGNGVFAAGASTYPSSTFNAANYWVDVVFSTSNSDLTPPEITNIVQTTIDGSKVEITWDTDELATSKIEYSTSVNYPASETSTISGSAFVRNHKITIGGLQPNTTYYYRVISTDGPGNATTVEPPTFTLPGPTLRDTAEADFLAGSGMDTYVSGKADGELSLAPAIGQEFSGTSMPPGWIATPWGIGGFATVGDGVLRVDGSRVGTCSGDPCIEQAVYAAGRSIEFDAIFTGDAFQHAGLAVTLGSAQEPWAIFSTLFGGNLYARTNTGSQSQDILLGGTLLGAMHRYRIDWKHDGTVDYYVDGTLMASSSLVVPGPMRPVAASDFSVFGGNIIVNWLHMTPYGPAGTFHSRVFDAQSVVAWNSVQWQTNLPAGTTVSIQVRTGDTPIPDETWTAFVPIAAPGPLVNLQSRYIQYKASLTTADGALTPLLEDIIISTSHAPVAVDDSFRVAENTSRTFLSSGPGSLVFNDTDGDVNDVLRVKSVGAAGNGQVVLNGDGSVTYTPNANYSGPDSFQYVVTDGMMIASATVSLDVTSVNNAPEASNDFYTIDEDTALMVTAANGILANDLDAEGDILRAVLVSPPSFAASFSLNANGAFTYIPVASFAGPDHFTYKANDGELDSAVVTVQILMNQVNDPPIAEPDAFTAVLNQTLQVSAPGVLANDHDVEVESAAPLSAELVSTTTNGALVFNSDGSFEYTPNADYLGIDTFTYRARDSFAAAGNVTTVTLTVALKAVSATVVSGSTVTTGGTVSAEDPLQSAVTTPTNALIAIAQGVISDSQSPSGYTFLNQQVNIAVINPDGTEVFAPPQNPLTFTFTIDRSLIPPGQNEQTFEIFRNGVLVPNCLGATTIPASNLDPCVSARVSNAPASDSIQLTILTTHASRWNMGVSTSELGELTARSDGPFTTNRDVPLVIGAPGVLSNDFGTGTIEAEVFGTPEGGTVTLSPSGAFTFAPAPGFCGPASFAYTAGIGAERSPAATVSITINCDPVAQNDTTTVLEDSGETMIAVLTNDSDPDPGQTLRLDSVTQGAHGAVAASPDGMWLTYAPEPNFFGDDSFTYSVRDSLGGLATGTVHVTVTAVNDAPSFTKGANVSTGEDATAQTVAAWAAAISAGPGESDALTFVVTNDNASLFAAAPQVAADGTLTYTPAPDSFGVAIVSVMLTDNGGTANAGVDTSAADSFTITVGPVNDPPSFVKGADQSLLEDTGSQIVAQWATQISAGPGEDGQSVHFLVAADDPSLFSVLPAVDPTGTLTYDPAPNAVGTATVTVRAQDDGGTANGGADTSAPQTFTITLNLVNDPPTFTKGLDQTVLEDSLPQMVDWASNMSPGPADEAGQLVAFVVTADRPELFTTQPAVAPNGTLTFAAAPDAYGVAAISIRLRDDGGTLNGGNDTSAPQSFTITILPVNDVPSFTKGSNPTVGEDSGPATIPAWAAAISAGPANETAQALSFVVSNDNNALFVAQPAVTANGTLTFTPAANARGTATVSVQLQDDGGTSNGGNDTTTVQTFAIHVVAVNDAPTFVRGADQTVLEDTAAVSVPEWATAISAGPQDESGQTVAFTVSNNNAALFTQQPAVSATGTLSFAVAPNVSGSAVVSLHLTDDGGTANGGSDTSAVQTFTITVTPVNDAPSFTKGADQTTFASAGTQAVAGWATDMTAGPNEAGQALSFTVTNSNNGLFSVQPAVAANGTLTYAPAGVAGSATVTVVLADNGGTASGGVDTTAPQTFVITIVPAPTSTTVTSSNPQSLAGLSISLTATVSPAAAGIPTGAVTFRRGTTPIGTVALVDGVATLNTASLPVGTHTITAAYGGSGAFAPSTSAGLTQTIAASATLDVKFQVQALQDNTSRPKVAKVPVPNALVKVFATADGCTGAIWRSIRPKKWGVIFDGEDGLGGVDGCQGLTVGTYEAVGTTDVNGDVSIIVPALSANFSNQYLVIGRATNFDYVKTATSSDPLYSQHPVVHVSAGSSKKVPLSMLATFNGKIVPGKQVEFFGSYLNLIEPEYVDWTEDQEQYPFVMEAQGDWNVTTSVAPPEGFIPDANSLNAVAADTTTAVQFTLTDVASDWTETQVQHAITHNGATTQQVSTVPMYDRKPTRARPDFAKMMHDTSGLIIDVMTNDRYAHQNGPISIVSSTPALNGVATLSEDELYFTYTPAPGFSGTDTFEYTIADAVGTRSTALVTITVLATPQVSASSVTFDEGHDGTVPGIVPIVLSNQSVEPVTVRYATADKSAVAGADYVAASGELTFTPGITRIDVPVGIIGELVAEANEAFEMQLSGVTGGVLTATSNGNVVIRDDDPPDIFIEPTATVVEGNVGSKNVALVVTMSQADADNVAVDFVTIDGTAAAGSDYVHQALTVTFYPGQKQHTIFIPILGDTEGELDETFTVQLRTPWNGVIVQPTALVTITNDDVVNVVTTTAADFAEETRSDVYIAESGNGELMLAPTLAEEFSTDVLPTGWSTTPVAVGGGVTIANGAMSVDGSAVITTPELFGYGKVLEFHATFSGAPNQSIGFGVDETLGAPMAMWMINERRQMVVRTIRGARFVESEIFGLDWLNVPHEYEVRWNAGNAQYYVDGTLMASHTQMGWSATQMRPVIIDGTAGDMPMTIKWMRMSPYAAEGTYTSKVFDAGLVVDWTKLTATRTLLSGTTYSLMYRTGNTPVPDATWTAFAAPGTGGALAGVSARYLQFEIRMTTTAPGRTPTVKDVTVIYKPQ